MRPKLAIIAGQDDLPRLIAEEYRATRSPYLVVSFQQDTQPWMGDHPHQEHLFEKPGRLFRSLRREAVDEVVFAGRTSRPKLRPWLFDSGALKIVGHVRQLLRKGDDGLLSGLAAIFESEGFRMRGAHEVLNGLDAGAGVLGRIRPADGAVADVRRGVEVLRALGPLDVGQAVVVADGLCLGVEAIGGTDRLLSSVAALPSDLRPDGRNGVLIKMPKPGQDRRLDIPTIGLETVRSAIAADLEGIAVETGGVNLLDRTAMIDAADAAGLFLWSFDSETL